MSESHLRLDGLEDLFAALGKKQQEKARYEISKYLRSTMRKRITAQRDVYDNPFAPRKYLPFSSMTYKKNGMLWGDFNTKWERHGPSAEEWERARVKKMLTGFRDKAYLHIDQSASEIKLGYKGRAATIAEVHNLGLRQRIKNQFGTMTNAQYPARQWMGFNDRDEDEIRKILKQVFSGA
jgi:phage virion morphogenesis protein